MKYRVIEVREYHLTPLLEKYGISRRKFAKLCGIGEEHLCRLEKGNYMATEATMKKITDAVEKLTNPTLE